MSNIDPYVLSPIEVMARTIFGEARGETALGQEAVANVIMNRVKSPVTWWGKDVRSVCLKPYQFSCWLPGDPNRAVLISLPPDSPKLAGFLGIAKRAVEGDLPDHTNGADSYQRIGTNAYWSKNLTPIATIGHHEFYRTV